MRCITALALIALASVSFAQNDKAYGDEIKKDTTETFFLTPFVDHLPLSHRVPQPDKFFGHIIGAPNVLDYASKIHAYFRALEKASPRIRVMSMGKSEEGREMIVAFISDESNLKRLDEIAADNATLGDPRKIKDQAEADTLIKRTLPMYWATGGMHAPETGPPEMLNELAYRLVTSEEPYIKDIRKNEIVMITPVLDVDGRERVVDLYRYRKANKDKPRIPLVYWGHYVAHDDNRDALTFRLALSQAMMKTWLRYHPTVLHDLHESVPLLYISTGTGPYNAWLDPIVISEWQAMAYNEIEQFTKLGVPGVWTHNYYDGWSASYGFYVANGHNGVGRFYETFSAGDADTGVRSTGGASSRDWYRPNPPFPRVRWSIRDNVNLSESGLLMGMHSVAVEKDRFLTNYYLKSKRSVAKATTEGPCAYVIPAATADTQFRTTDLLHVMDRQGVEVQKLTADANTKEGNFKAGSYVIRMDQPYSRMADMMLDSQYYKPSDPASYDDTGWQLGPLFDLKVTRVTDPAVLKAAMSPAPFQDSGTYPSVGAARVAIVHTWTDTQDEGWARMAFDNAHVPYTYVSVHELRDTPDLKAKYDAIVIPQAGGSAQSIVHGSTGDAPIPWKATPDYPNLGGPDSADDIRGGIELSGMLNLEKFVKDGGKLVCIGNTCHLPVDYGLVSGVSIAEHPTLRAPGGVYRVEKGNADSPVLKGHGDAMGVYFNSFSCVVLDGGGGPGGGGRRGGRGGGGAGGADRASGRGSLTDPDVIQGRPPYTPKEQPGDTPENEGRRPQPPTSHVLLRFAAADQLLMSGMIENGQEMAGHPALIECTLGKGHVYLFSFNPFWRGESVGSYDLVFNAVSK